MRIISQNYFIHNRFSLKTKKALKKKNFPFFRFFRHRLTYLKSKLDSRHEVAEKKMEE